MSNKSPTSSSSTADGRRHSTTSLLHKSSKEKSLSPHSSNTPTFAIRSTPSSAEQCPKPILFKRQPSKASVNLSQLPPLSTNGLQHKENNDPQSPLSHTTAKVVKSYNDLTSRTTSFNYNETIHTPLAATAAATATHQALYDSPVIHGRSGSSISFQVPPPGSNKHRGSISARPSVTKMPTLEQQLQSGIPSSRQPSNNLSTPLSAKNPLPFDFSTINTATTTHRRSSSWDNTRRPSLTTPTDGSRTGSVASNHSANNNSNSRKTSLKSPNLGSGISIQSPILFELPQHNHPLQHFSFPNENTVPQQTQDLGIGLVGNAIPQIGRSSPHGSIKRKTAITKTVVSDPVGPVVPFTEYLSKEDDNKIHILIGATGSVATIKIPQIIDKLFKIYTPDKVSIQLVVTQAAEHFLRGLKISTEVKIWRENEEWSQPMTRPGDPILHVELRKWADIFLIAPMSANSLAKISNGLADNLLTSIVRVWNPSIPIIIAPAMNTFMYTHPVTKKQLAILNEDFKFIEVLKPIEKVLVCGDIGMGGMREWSDIVDIVVKRIKELNKLKLEFLKSEGVVDDSVIDENDENDEDDDDDDDDDEDDEDDEDYDDEDDDDEDDEDDEDDDDEDDEDDEDDDDVFQDSTEGDVAVPSVKQASITPAASPTTNPNVLSKFKHQQPAQQYNKATDFKSLDDLISQQY